jgi:hypothetical protein
VRILRSLTNRSPCVRARGAMRYAADVMDALRCTQCGDTRWSLTRPTGTASVRTCELCGGPMVVERRQPNHGPLRLPAERRDAWRRPRPSVNR